MVFFPLPIGVHVFDADIGSFNTKYERGDGANIEDCPASASGLKSTGTQMASVLTFGSKKISTWRYYSLRHIKQPRTCQLPLGVEVVLKHTLYLSEL